MAVSGYIVAGRRERRVLVRASRAAWRLHSAERKRDWALGSAKGEGVSIGKLAAAGLSPSRYISYWLAPILITYISSSVNCGRSAGPRPRTSPRAAHGSHAIERTRRHGTTQSRDSIAG